MSTIFEFPQKTTIRNVQVPQLGIDATNKDYTDANDALTLSASIAYTDAVVANTSGIPGGNNTTIQFNNNGEFGGSDQLTWRSILGGILTVDGIIESKGFHNYFGYPLELLSSTDINITSGSGSPFLTNISIINGGIGGNISIGSTNTNTILIGVSGVGVDFNNSNVTLGSNGNVHITGGSSNQVLSTDGSGNLSWVNQSGGGSANASGPAGSIQIADGSGGLTNSSSLLWNESIKYLNVSSISSITAYNQFIIRAADGNDNEDEDYDGGTLSLRGGDVWANTLADGYGGGSVIISGGNGNTSFNSYGGNIRISGGDAYGTEDGGDILLEGGDAFGSGDAGRVTISSGSTTTGNGVTTNITGGNTDSGTGGDVDIYAGSAVSSGFGGNINLDGGWSNDGPQAYGNVELGLYHTKAVKVRSPFNISANGITFADGTTQYTANAGGGNTSGLVLENPIYTGIQVSSVGPTDTFVVQGNASALLPVGAEITFEGTNDTWTITSSVFGSITTEITVTPNWVDGDYTPFYLNRILKQFPTEPSISKIAAGNGITIDYNSFDNTATFQVSSSASDNELLFSNNGLFFGVSGVTSDGSSISMANTGIKITGGFSNQVLSTDGTGNLSWVTQSGSSNAVALAYTQFTPSVNGINQIFTNDNLTYFTSGDYAIVFKNGVALSPSDYTISGNTLTVGVYLVTSDAIDVAPTSSGGTATGGGVSNTQLNQANTWLQANDSLTLSSAQAYTDATNTWIQANISGGNTTPGGINGSIQFNNNGVLGGNANFTYDSVAGKLDVFQVNVSNELNVDSAVISLLDGDLVIQRSNARFVESNTHLGDIANVHITGGSSNQVLSTDGTGNLSWVTQSGGGNTTPGGIDGSIQFNNNGVLDGSANLVYDIVDQKLTIRQMNVGQQLNLIDGSVFSILNGSAFIETSNVQFINCTTSLGNIANVRITGGSSNQVLSTDGSGNLSWVNQSNNVTSPITYSQLSALPLTAGSRTFISDASALGTWGTVVSSGGGSTVIPVWCDGTDWRVG